MTNLPKLLEDVPLNTLNNMWFMLDGAPAHYRLKVIKHLKEEYPNLWICQGGLVVWPARSPDLNLFNFLYMAI